jgi:hypothetical protein
MLIIKSKPPFLEPKVGGNYKVNCNETDALIRITRYHNIKKMLIYLENPNIPEKDKLRFIKENDIIDDTDPELKGWITE